MIPNNCKWAHPCSLIVTTFLKPYIVQVHSRPQDLDGIAQLLVGHHKRVSTVQVCNLGSPIVPQALNAANLAICQLQGYHAYEDLPDKLQSQYAMCLLPFILALLKLLISHLHHAQPIWMYCTVQKIDCPEESAVIVPCTDTGA